MLSKDKLWVTNASPLSLETVVTAFAACALLSVTSTEANKDTSSLRLELSIRKEIITCDTSISSNAAYEFRRAGPNFEIASSTSSSCTFKRQEITNWTKRSFPLTVARSAAVLVVVLCKSSFVKSLSLSVVAAPSVLLVLVVLTSTVVMIINVVVAVIVLKSFVVISPELDFSPLFVFEVLTSTVEAIVEWDFDIVIVVAVVGAVIISTPLPAAVIISPFPMVTVVGSCVVTAVSSPPPPLLFTASLLETFEKIAVFTKVFELEVTNKPT